MNTWRSFGNASPALTSWRATPLPQSTTYSVSLTTMTCEAETFSLRGRGPPPVPRRIRRVFALCARAQGAALKAASVARKWRRSISVGLWRVATREVDEGVALFARREGAVAHDQAAGALRD